MGGVYMEGVPYYPQCIITYPIALGLIYLFFLSSLYDSIVVYLPCPGCVNGGCGWWVKMDIISSWSDGWMYS